MKIAVRSILLGSLALLAACSSGLDAPPPELASQATSSTLSVPVVSASDDIEEFSSGTMSVGKALDFSQSQQKVALRFGALALPKGATITSANISLTALVADAGSVNLTLRAQAADSAATFSSTSRNVSSRPLTTASAVWQPGAWSIGQIYRTVDMSAVVQEVVSRSGWNPGNAIAFVVTGDSLNKRSASARDRNEVNAPVLNISYTLPPTPNPEPEPEPEPEPGTPTAEQTLWLNRLKKAIVNPKLYSRSETDLTYIANLDDEYWTGRFGGMLATNLVLAYRATGDPLLVQELDRFMSLLRSKLQDADGDGYRNFVYRRPGEFFEKDTSPMEEMFAGALVAVSAYTLKQAGYSDNATFWTDFLKYDFFPKWAARPKGLRHPLTHSNAANIRLRYYYGKLTGDTAQLAEAQRLAGLLSQTIRPDGWSHYLGQTTGCQPAVYIPLTLQSLVDLASNGSNLISEATMRQAAEVTAVRVMNDDSGASLSGNSCGEGILNNSAAISTWAYTAAMKYDSTGRIKAISERAYARAERNPESPVKLNIPAGMVFGLD